MTLQRITAGFLRCVAILQVLTAAVVFMPVAWIAAWHAWIGLGLMPDDPFLRYVIRGAGYTQAAVGVLLWIMAGDVVRYRPLVIATAAIYLAAGPAFYLIETIAGMPRFWCLIDSVSCFSVGVVLMALCRLSSERKKAKGQGGDGPGI
ncbi:MAG: hypothetical protein QOE70_3741 [Chthoniobacter sp.]|jgi:hypothetical protein|nr:hypothetical protein [Chthoniobacter sp.]